MSYEEIEENKGLKLKELKNFLDHNSENEKWYNNLNENSTLMKKIPISSYNHDDSNQIDSSSSLSLPLSQGGKISSQLLPQTFNTNNGDPFCIEESKNCKSDSDEKEKEKDKIKEKKKNKEKSDRKKGKDGDKEEGKKEHTHQHKHGREHIEKGKEGKEKNEGKKKRNKKEGENKISAENSHGDSTLDQNCSTGTTKFNLYFMMLLYL
jgi:hypothetical protein